MNPEAARATVAPFYDALNAPASKDVRTLVEGAAIADWRSYAGETVSKERLLADVWGYHFDPGSNVVDVYVGYLRRKLEEPFGRPLIRTVRGAGYVIDPP